ncbi:MAG: hypothetical protein ACREMQ_03865 [Longimicrobiales bacterium]
MNCVVTMIGAPAENAWYPGVGADAGAEIEGIASDDVREDVPGRPIVAWCARVSVG